jgi:RES domain-containing protein
MRLALEAVFLVIFGGVKQFYNILIVLVLTVFSTEQLAANDTFVLTEKSYSSVEDISNAGGRFIAKSGDELKSFLDNLTDLPAGKTYTSDMYRSIGSKYNNPLEIHSGSIRANYRYNKPGEGGLYLSKTKSGNITEISHYDDITNYKTYKYSNVKIGKMLDLTDDVVRKQLGVDFGLLTRTSNNLDEAYEFTHKIGTWAANKGYKGLIVPGARGSKDYVNTIIFKQIDVNYALKHITPKITKY